ncbi:MAG TPA: hypothetical protein VL551_08000 [Actinospica sp.]|nr:hypothetical protein [Actinospica sp.]
MEDPQEQHDQQEVRDEPGAASDDTWSAPDATEADPEPASEPTPEPEPATEVVPIADQVPTAVTPTPTPIPGPPTPIPAPGPPTPVPAAGPPTPIPAPGPPTPVPAAGPPTPVPGASSGSLPVPFGPPPPTPIPGAPSTPLPLLPSQVPASPLIPQQYPQGPYLQGPYPQQQPQLQQQPGTYGFPTFGPYQPPAPAPAPDAAKARQRKRLLLVGAAVVVLALIGVGVYVLLPNGGNSVVSAVTCRPATLSSCLIQAPDGANRQSGGTGQWPQQTVSTADLYASNIVTDSPGVADETQGLLGQDGLKTIAHNDWTAVDGDSIDIVVLEFDTQKGAQNWNSTRSGEILAAYPGTSVAIPGDTAEAHAAVKADSKGDVEAAYSTVVGRMVLNVAYSSPSQLSVPDLKNWAGTELTSLRSAPAPAADPAPKAAATQQVACATGLQTCLMAEPGDGSAWTSPSDTRWVSGATLTPAQFVHLWWEASSAAVQQQVLDTFTADGVTGIAHEAWTANSGYEQADIYLLQTVTASGATKLTSSDFGEPVWGGGLTGVDYTIPNASGTQAWHTNKADSNGFIDFAYTSTVGNVIVFGWEYFYGSFDSGTANSWAEPQVDRVQASEQTAPMGLFSMSAPTLPAAKSASCAPSGDCLIPLPSGAKDTTSSSYQSGKNLNAASYADRYETNSSDDISTWLTSDGFVSAEHRSWTASNGATADAVLLKYGSAAQAHAAALLEYGGNAANNRSCTDTAVPDSLCLAAPVSATDLLQKETVRVLAWKGDYEVSVSVTMDNAADLTQAYGWAQQQLDTLASTS